MQHAPAISLAHVITCFETEFLAQHQGKLLPSQIKALKLMRSCRSSLSAPQALLPGAYFLITFTLPQELRGLAWSHQPTVYAALMQCAWDTLAQFSLNHRQLQGSAAAVGVLHTHSRRLEFHPHVHLAMPGAAFDAKHGLWRSLRKTAKGGHYLFNHKALAAVFRGKLLATLNAQGLTVPLCLPERWVVDCKSVGNGEMALVYLGRYLYRGVIQEKDIVRCALGRVTFRYRDSASGWRCCAWGSRPMQRRPAH